MTVKIEKVNPPTLPDAPSFGYSQITVAEPGKMAFIAGQVALRPGGGRPPEGLEDQTRIAMQNLVHALEAVGGGVGNLVAMRIYIVDLQPDDTEALMKGAGAFLGDVLPTMTVVGATGLAVAGLKIEIEATAVV